MEKNSVVLFLTKKIPQESEGGGGGLGDCRPSPLPCFERLCNQIIIIIGGNILGDILEAKGWGLVYWRRGLRKVFWKRERCRVKDSPKK